MQTLCHKLKSVSPRLWLILAYLFTSLVVSRFAGSAAAMLGCALIVPAALMLVPAQLRGREGFTRKKPLIAVCAGLIWLCLSMLLNCYKNGGRLDANQVLIYWNLLFAWLFMLFIPADMTRGEMRRELLSIGFIFNICFVPFALLALTTVFTGRVIYLPRCDYPLGISIENLPSDQIWLLVNPNHSGRIAAFNILFCLYALFVQKGWLRRALTALCLAVNVFALTHIQSRACVIAVGIGVGLMVFRWLFRWIRVRFVRFPAAFLALLLTLLLTMMGTDALFKADVTLALTNERLRVGSERAIERLNAEMMEKYEGEIPESEQMDAATQSNGRFMQNGFFSASRLHIWRACFDYIKQHKSVLLYGYGLRDGEYLLKDVADSIDPAQYDFPRFDQELRRFTHVHCSYLDALIRGGIPYILLIAAFLLMLIPPCWRVLTRCGDDLFFAAILLIVALWMGVPEVGLFVGESWLNGLSMLLAGYVLRLGRGSAKN